MSDDQIVVLHRGLISALDSDEVGGGQHLQGVANGMLDQLEGGLGDLASRDPERVRGLVEHCMQSDKRYDHELALGVVPSLVDYDYAFTRDTLISLRIDGSEQASEGTHITIPELMRDRLTPEQAADFNAHLQARDRDPSRPARPES